jgi:hypothetical protein
VRNVRPGCAIMDDRRARAHEPRSRPVGTCERMMRVEAPADVVWPPGLLLWPLMAFGARVVKMSTRRQLLEQVRADRATAALSEA